MKGWMNINVDRILFYVKTLSWGTVDLGFKKKQTLPLESASPEAFFKHNPSYL